MNTAEIKCVRVVAMATNFGIKIVINWLYENNSIIAPRQLLMEGGLSARLTEYCQYPVTVATSFWLSIGYNFGCLIASDTLCN